MSEASKPNPEDLPQAEIVSKRRLNPSIVWLIPLLAALIGGWLAVNAILSRGPTITISFSSGEGLEAGKTRIKYKDVDIGEVTAVTLSPDHKHIQVKASLVKEASSLLVDDSRFWVVRPRINGGTVSGLGTLLGGAYIGMDAGKSTQARDQYNGLDEAPIITGDLPGHKYTLLSDDLGSLVVGSPVYYRRVPVGQVVGYHLTQGGQSVAVSVFINQPYDTYITSNSRFWHASGLDLTVDANGLKLDTQSMVSLAMGGVAFDTPDSDVKAPPLKADQPFVLSSDRDHAMRQADPDVKTLLLRFKESLRGLVVGAPVDFRGITVGEVAAIGLDADERTSDLSMSVRIHVYPSRLLALAGEKDVRAQLEQLTLKRLIARGLRAQLRTANLLTGQLYIGVDYFPEARKQTLQMHDGMAVLPSVPADMVELQHTLARIVKSIDRMQLDATAASFRQSMHTLNGTLKRTDKLVDGVNAQVLPQTLQTLKSLQQTLGAARQTLAPDSPMQQDLRDAIQQVSAAAKSVQNLSDTLDRNPEALVRGKPKDKQ